MRVRFTQPAGADLQQIYAYVAKHNPVEASRLVARLIERARSLGDTPHEGRKTDVPSPRGNVKPLPPGAYDIRYRVRRYM
jgi:plasmid stabilization system protein ParE